MNWTQEQLSKVDFGKLRIDGVTVTRNGDSIRILRRDGYVIASRRGEWRIYTTEKEPTRLALAAIDQTDAFIASELTAVDQIDAFIYAELAAIEKAEREKAEREQWRPCSREEAEENPGMSQRKGEQIDWHQYSASCDCCGWQFRTRATRTYDPVDCRDARELAKVAWVEYSDCQFDWKHGTDLAGLRGMCYRVDRYTVPKDFVYPSKTEDAAKAKAAEERCKLEAEYPLTRDEFRELLKREFAAGATKVWATSPGLSRCDYSPGAQDANFDRYRLISIEKPETVPAPPDPGEGFELCSKDEAEEATYCFADGGWCLTWFDSKKIAYNLPSSRYAFRRKIKPQVIEFEADVISVAVLRDGSLDISLTAKPGVKFPIGAKVTVTAK